MLPRLAALFQHSDPWVVRHAGLATFDVGLAAPERGRLAPEIVASELSSLSTTLAWEAVVNGIGPISRRYPDLLDQGIEAHQDYLPRVDQDSDPMRHHLAATVRNELLKLLDLASRESPEVISKRLASPVPWKAELGLELLARWLDREPERIPEALDRLGSIRRSLWPQVRLAAARGTEAVTVLRLTYEALSSPETTESWLQTLRSLHGVGIHPAVTLSLDRLEPEVVHR